MGTLSNSLFTRLGACSVDTIQKWRDCACRAYGNQDQLDLTAAPPRCDHLRERARKLIAAARRFLLD